MTLRTLARCAALLLLVTASAPGATQQPPPSKHIDVVWADGRHASLPVPPGLKAYLVTKVAPDYPYEARRRRITGTGLYKVSIATPGVVTRVEITESAGSDLLDREATAALMKWRYKPGVFQKVFVPVTWAMLPFRDPPPR